MIKIIGALIIAGVTGIQTVETQKRLNKHRISHLSYNLFNFYSVGQALMYSITEIIFIFYYLINTK